MRNIITSIIVFLMLSACTLPSAPATITVPTVLQPPMAQGSPTHISTQEDIPNVAQNPSTPSSFSLQELTERAKNDLSQRLSIPVSQIMVVNARNVVWSNASLGCPQPGMMYAEVLRPGYLILLNANGQDYEYHAGKNSDAFYCETPSPPVEGMPDNT